MAYADYNYKEKSRAPRAQNDRLNEKIANLEGVIRGLRTELTSSQQRSDNLNDLLCVYRQRHRCEALYTEGNAIGAAQSLLEIIETKNEDVRTDTSIVEWLSSFPNKCVVALERAGDDALKAEKRDETLAAYSIALSVGPPTPDALLTKWASTMLVCGSAKEALDVAAKFKLPRFVIYRAICDTLEGSNRVAEAIECFRWMQSELAVGPSAHSERARWEPEFQQRCSPKLEELADAVMRSQNHHEAIGYFSTILELDPPDRVNILIKRSKARARMNSWEDALMDVDEIVKLNKSSHRNYEHNDAARCHAEAVEAFETMVLKLRQAPASGQYVGEYRPSVDPTSDAISTLPSCATCRRKSPVDQPDLSDKAVQALAMTDFEPVSPMAREPEMDYENVEG